MYLLSCLLFSTLVVNTLAVDIIIKAENFEKLTKAFTPLCACTEFKLNEETACLESYKPISENVTASCKYFASLIMNKKPASEIGKAPNPSKTGSSEKTTDVNPTRTGSSETKTTDTAVIAPIGCSCVYNNATAENAKKTLNCSISNESKDFLKNLPEAEETLKLQCQKLTYESLSKRDTDKSEYNKKLTHVISTIACESQPAFCDPAFETHLNLTVEKAKAICACTNETLELTTSCDNNVSTNEIQLGDIEQLCKSIKIRYSELYERAQQNKTDINATTTALNITTTGSSGNATTDAEVINAPIGCSCVYINPTAENAKKTLYCSISNETKDFLKNLPEAMKVFNSYCQNITYESLSKPDTDKSEYNKNLTEVISNYVCELDQTFCVTESFKNFAVETVKQICARSNVSLGLTTKSKDKDISPFFTALLKKENQSRAIDHLCESIKIRYIELYEVAQQTVTDINDAANNNQAATETTPANIETKTETTIDKHQIKNETSTINNPSDTVTTGSNNQTSTGKPTAKHNESTTKKANATSATPSKHVSPPADKDQPPTEAGTHYSTGTVVGIVFCAIAFGSLIAVAVKMSYTRYRRRTYAVNQIRS